MTDRIWTDKHNGREYVLDEKWVSERDGIFGRFLGKLDGHIIMSGMAMMAGWQPPEYPVLKELNPAEHRCPWCESDKHTPLRETHRGRDSIYYDTECLSCHRRYGPSRDLPESDR